MGKEGGGVKKIRKMERRGRGEEGGRERGEWKKGIKGRGKDGDDLLPANKVNKITPTPQTSTGSARYGASLFNYSIILSVSMTNVKGKEEAKRTKHEDKETNAKKKAKQKVHTSGAT